MNIQILGHVYGKDLKCPNSKGYSITVSKTYTRNAGGNATHLGYLTRNLEKIMAKLNMIVLQYKLCKDVFLSFASILLMADDVLHLFLLKF